MQKVLIVILTAALLAGCQTNSTQFLSNPERVEIAGSYTNAPTGMLYPIAADGFRRVSIIRYDTEERYISAGYDLYQPPEVIAATVFMRPSPPFTSFGSPADVVASAQSTLCENSYEARKAQILDAHPGANLLSEEPTGSTKSGPSTIGWSALYEYEEALAGVRQPVHSRLDMLCYINDEWTLTYRFTYPAALDATQQIDRFIENVPSM